jgi:hypothetical protein
MEYDRMVQLRMPGWMVRALDEKARQRALDRSALIRVTLVDTLGLERGTGQQPSQGGRGPCKQPQ